MTKIIGVVQARMGSTRMPGKVMLPLAGKPVIWHMFDRMSRVPELSEVVLATTTDQRNQEMVDYAHEQGWPVYAVEAEDDLALRLSGAAREYGADAILRTAADCPLIDPPVLQRMVKIYLDDGAADFVSNRVRWSYPIGLSADVISSRSLNWCDENLTDPEDRELFAVWIRDHPERFRVVSVEHDEDLSHYEWMIDEPRDLAFMTEIFDALYQSEEVFSLADVLRYLER